MKSSLQIFEITFFMVEKEQKYGGREEQKKEGKKEGKKERKKERKKKERGKKVVRGVSFPLHN